MTEQTTGSVIAGYRIESVIGRGGMATVYRAEDTRLGRKVALKLLSTALAANEQFRQRFIRESRLAASLDHPNIVPIYEAGDADGVLFIAMRYVVGSDLKDLLARGGALDPERAVRLFTQIGDALDAAHELGLVHRDVKPGNILITQTHEHGDHVTAEHVYLTDFGLTKRTSSLSGGLTGTGHFLGTVDYVAPEQIQGKPVGPAADMYALGCLLYECLTGRVPFRRDDDAAVLWAHLIEPPPPPSVLRPELPTGVNAVVARAMAKFPEERFASCHEMVRALADAVRAPGAEGVAAAGTGGSVAGSQQTRWSGERVVPEQAADVPAEVQAGAPAGPVAAAAPDVAETAGPVGDQGDAPAGEWAPAGPGQEWAQAGWAEQVEVPAADGEVAEQWGWDGEGTSWPLEEELVAGEVVGAEAFPGEQTVAGEGAVATTTQAAPGEVPASRTRRWLLPVVAGTVVFLAVLGFLLVRLSGSGGQDLTRTYRPGNSTVPLTMGYPDAWSVQESPGTSAVVAARPDVAGPVFFGGGSDGGWTAMGRLVGSDPGAAVGAYLTSGFTAVDPASSAFGDTVIQSLPPGTQLLPGRRTVTVGGVPAVELTGAASSPAGGASLSLLIDVVQTPQGDQVLLAFFAPPGQLDAQRALFDRVRASVRLG
ncbi:serine/threonine-protein kinase [Oryzihumus sp.]|uniref:serine/threonine-protein kinase n=1 Tax=Oryzihumus sp. TaxID=1968903 RepID=UPI002ED8F867